MHIKRNQEKVVEETLMLQWQLCSYYLIRSTLAVMWRLHVYFNRMLISPPLFSVPAYMYKYNADCGLQTSYTPG